MYRQMAATGAVLAAIDRLLCRMVTRQPRAGKFIKMIVLIQSFTSVVCR
jgi:hypothetical protein